LESFRAAVAFGRLPNDEFAFGAFASFGRLAFSDTAEKAFGGPAAASDRQAADRCERWRQVLAENGIVETDE